MRSLPTPRDGSVLPGDCPDPASSLCNCDEVPGAGPRGRSLSARRGPSDVLPDYTMAASASATCRQPWSRPRARGIMICSLTANTRSQRGRQMPVARSDIFITAPPEEVWSLISDLERGPEWSLVTLECKLTSGGLPGLGSTYRSVSKFVTSRVTTEHEIVEWEPPRRMVSKVTRGGESMFTQLCEREGEGTVLTMINEFSLPGAVPGFVAERLIGQVTTTLAGELAQIKEVVEQSCGRGQMPSLGSAQGR
jgi:uncharacterized membrane protein